MSDSVLVVCLPGDKPMDSTTRIRDSSRIARKCHREIAQRAWLPLSPPGAIKGIALLATACGQGAVWALPGSSPARVVTLFIFS